jgi:site-specific recombinase XerD
MSRPYALADAIRDYLAYLRAQNYSEETVVSYANTYKLFLRSTFTKIDDTTVGWFLKRYDNPATKNKALFHLRSFHAWAHGTNENPGVTGRLTLKAVKEPDSAPKTFSEADLDAFLGVLWGIRRSVWAMATVMRNTGLRISEAYLLKKENLVVDPEMGAYLRFYGKGARERLVPLNEEALDAFTVWISRIKKPSIYTVRRAFVKAAEVSGVHLTPHNFRSSLGTKLANAGHSYDSIADLFGHTSSNVTRKRYARVAVGNLRKLVT